MPLSIAQWTPEQWGVFATVLAAGLLAAVLLPLVRAWRLHHPYPASASDRRWERRRRRAIAEATGPLTPVVDPVEQQLVQAWHADATSETVGVIVAVEPLVDPDIAEALGAAFDAALAKFRADVEPAMRTARLWTLQAGETYAENALRVLRITERTGEYPMVTASH